MANTAIFFDGARVRMKGKPGIWKILSHESIQKGSGVKITGKIKCRNEETGEVKFCSEKNCEPA